MMFSRPTAEIVDDLRDRSHRPGGLAEEAADALERAARWKAEAIQVIGTWEECYDVLDQAGQGARIGQFKSDHVRRWIEQTLVKA